jgi:hypothetical protein
MLFAARRARQELFSDQQPETRAAIASDIASASLARDGCARSRGNSKLLD